MRTRNILLTASACLAVALLFVGSKVLRAQPADPLALTGQVTSAEEGPMEGVLVSAKKADSNITVTVVTNKQGHFQFGSDRLSPGQYSLSIRAEGYDLAGPSTVDIPSQKTATADLKLSKTNNLASQLTNTEWIMSFPGTEQQRQSVRGCTHCHTLERIVRSSHDEEEFKQVIERMTNYTPASFPLMIQPPKRGERMGGGELSTEQVSQREQNRIKLAKYLSTLNLSSTSKWEYPLQTLPRPSGEATRVIVTKYDLPKRTRQPHDVIVDSQGMVWYASFGEPILGKLDPKTGKITEYPVPVTKPGYIIGTLDIEFDKDENIWLAMTYQGAVAKFDRKTEKFQVFRLPPDMDDWSREFTFVAPQHSDVDGKVWINESGTYTQLRLDVNTGKFESFALYPVPRPNTYEVTSDSFNNAWVFVMGRQNIGKIDAKTGKISIYDVPTPRAAPRRGMVDSQNRVWFAENFGNKVGMFDPKTEQFKEWPAPIKYYYPYDVTVDKDGDAWAVTEYADRVLRINTKTDQSVEYLMPDHTNMRRAWVDNSTTPPTFWVGNDHGASILRVQPMD
jgi:virginiamycin B lyase